MIGSGLGFIT